MRSSAFSVLFSTPLPASILDAEMETPISGNQVLMIWEGITGPQDPGNAGVKLVAQYLPVDSKPGRKISKKQNKTKKLSMGLLLRSEDMPLTVNSSYLLYDGLNNYLLSLFWKYHHTLGWHAGSWTACGCIQRPAGPSTLVCAPKNANSAHVCGYIEWTPKKWSDKQSRASKKSIPAEAEELLVKNLKMNKWELPE